MVGLGRLKRQEELGHELWARNAFAMRQLARHRQKNDQGEPERLLVLLLRGDFPAVHLPRLKGTVLKFETSFPLFPEVR